MICLGLQQHPIWRDKDTPSIHRLHRPLRLADTLQDRGDLQIITTIRSKSGRDILTRLTTEATWLRPTLSLAPLNIPHLPLTYIPTCYPVPLYNSPLTLTHYKSTLLKLIHMCAPSDIGIAIPEESVEREEATLPMSTRNRVGERTEPYLTPRSIRKPGDRQPLPSRDPLVYHENSELFSSTCRVFRLL